MSENRKWLSVTTLALIILLIGSYPTPSRAYILGLSGYAKAAATDPFFALPGTDTEILDSNVLKFEKTLRVALPPFSEADAQPYPIAFLKTLSGAEAARRQLIEYPTYHAARIYHRALLDVFSAYAADVSRLIEYVGAADAGASQYGFISGETTRAYVLQILEESLDRVSGYEAAERERFSCIQTPSIGCTMEVKEILTNASLGIFHKPDEISTTRSALRAYEKATRGGESTEVELSQSSCYPSEQLMVYDVVSGTSRLSQAPMVWMRPLNNLYLYDLASTTRPTLLALREAGARYEYQPLTAYLCPDFGHESSRALTALYAYNVLKREPIAGTDPARMPLLKAQKAFLESEGVSEPLFREVASEASKLVYTHSKGIRTEDAQMRQLQELALLARTNGAHFEKIVGYFDDFQAGNAVFFFATGGPIEDFVITRSGLSALLLMFNETGATPSSTSLLSKRSSATVAIPDLRAYWGDLHSYVPPSQLQAVLKESADAHASAYGPLIDALVARRKAATR